MRGVAPGRGPGDHFNHWAAPVPSPVLPLFYIHVLTAASVPTKTEIPPCRIPDPLLPSLYPQSPDCTRGCVSRPVPPVRNCRAANPPCPFCVATVWGAPYWGRCRCAPSVLPGIKWLYSYCAPHLIIPSVAPPLISPRKLSYRALLSAFSFLGMPM